MPNEPVQCPNCGSGDVRQLAADSYRCEHCQTSFHWVDPTKKTVVQKPSVCKCGRVAVAFCSRCGQGVCQEHGGTGFTKPATMSSDHLAYCMARLRATFCNSSLYKACMEKHRIPADEEAVVCRRCAGDCARALEAIEQSLHRAAEERHVCAKCFSDHVQGQCVNCGVAVCSQHGAICRRCHQLVCEQHINDTGWCHKCSKAPAKPWILRVLFGD